MLVALFIWLFVILVIWIILTQIKIAKDAEPLPEPSKGDINKELLEIPKGLSYRDYLVTLDNNETLRDVNSIRSWEYYKMRFSVNN